MINNNVNYIPVLIKFNDSEIRPCFMLKDSEDQDGDPYFCDSVKKIMGMYLPNELHQFRVEKIESISALTEVKSN